MEAKWILFTIMCLGAVIMCLGFYLSEKNIKNNLSEKHLDLCAVLVWGGAIIFIGLALTIRILKSCSII